MRWKRYRNLYAFIVAQRFWTVVFMNTRARPGDAVVDSNADQLDSLMELEMLISPCNWGAEWALEQLANKLATHGVIWTNYLTERLKNAEKKLLEEFPLPAREFVRLQSLQIIQELSPSWPPALLLSEQVRLAWLAEQLLLRKLVEGKKLYRAAGRRRELEKWLRLMKKRGRLGRKLLAVTRRLT